MPGGRPPKLKVEIRPMLEGDIPAVIELCKRVYEGSTPWSESQLLSQLKIFPRGQLVAFAPDNKDVVVAYSASLIVNWDDYEFNAPWRDMTDGGNFTNHDPVHGRTLYGAEVMVDPKLQGAGVGAQVYEARRLLVRELSLLRIRAGARLRDYHKVAAKMTPQDYVMNVVLGRLVDPTLSFQLKQGFQVLGVVGGYLREDPESQGFAAVIEWINPLAAEERHFAQQKRSPYYVEDYRYPPRKKVKTLT